MKIDVGFEKQNAVIVAVDPNAAGYQVDTRLEKMMEMIEERVSALAGVRHASFAFEIFGGGWTGPVRVPGRPTSDQDPDVFHNIVGSQHLRAMKTPLILGRNLSSRDDAAARKVSVINEAMAQAYFPGVSAIGRVFSVGTEPEWQNIEVVGVAKDAKYMNLQERPRPAALYPHAQHGMFLYNLLVLLCYKRRAQQKGQCGSWVRRKRAILIRRVAIESGLCRSARMRRAARFEVQRKLRGA